MTLDWIDALANGMPKFWMHLSTNPKCEVLLESIWSSDLPRCLARDEAKIWLKTQSYWFQLIQRARLSGSELLAQSGADPVLLFRKLLFAERGHTEIVETIRGLGLVHVYTAAAMHLYSLRYAIDHLFLKISEFSRDRFSLWPKIAGLVFWVLAVILWSLTQFRIAWLRGFFLLMLRTYLRRRGLSWPMLRSILTLCIFEMTCVLLFALFRPGIETSSYGRAHFYTASLGGACGLLFLPELKKFKWMQSYYQKVKLSFGSSIGACIADISTLGMPILPGTILLNVVSGILLIMLVYPLVCVFWLLGFDTLLVQICGWSSVAVLYGVEITTNLFTPRWIFPNTLLLSVAFILGLMAFLMSLKRR